MSLDGHIFRTEDITEKINQLEYSSPNWLETALNKNPIDLPYMACSEKPCLVNLAINRVQDTHKNKCGKVDPFLLNFNYIRGIIFDIDDVVEHSKKMVSCHDEWKPKYLPQ